MNNFSFLIENFIWTNETPKSLWIKIFDEVKSYFDFNLERLEMFIIKCFILIKR